MNFAQRIKHIRDDSRLEAALVQWAREYGHGPADNLGYGSQNALHRLEKHAGWLPPPEPVRAPIRTEADRLEDIVRALERGDGWKHAQVLRIDYYQPNIIMESRLKRLRQVGVTCSPRGYYDYLAIAKEYVRIRLWIK